MKKSNKVLSTLVACCAIVNCMAISSSAATAFGFNLGTGGNSTSYATKYNNTTYASVSITSGTLSSSGWMRLYVTKNSSAVSNSVTATSLGNYSIYYNPVVPSGSLGLRGEAGYYSVSAAGEWTP